MASEYDPKTLYKAQAFAGQEVLPLRLEATEELPDVSRDIDPLGAARLRHDQQAKIVVDALFASLPGGTIDAILCQMLDRKRCLWVRTFESRT